MKKLLILTLVLAMLFMLAACTNDGATNQDPLVEAAVDASVALMDGYFILRDGQTSLSVKVTDHVIESVHPLSRIDNWSSIKAKIEGLDGPSLMALGEELPADVKEPLEKILHMTEEDLVFDFTPKNTVAEFVEDFGGMIKASATGYYNGTTFHALESDVDFGDHMGSEIIAIALEGQDHRAVAIFDHEDYEPGYYTMGAGGPSRLDYAKIHNAGGLRIYIEAEGPQDQETVSLDGRELSPTPSLRDLKDQLIGDGFKNIGFYKGTSSDVGEAILDIDAYVENHPFARVSSFATFDDNMQRTHLAIYHDFDWMGMGGPPELSIEALKAQHALKVFVGGSEGQGTAMTFTDALDLASVASDLLELVGSGMGGQNPIHIMLEDGQIEAVTSLERVEALASQGYKFDGSGQEGGNFRFYTSLEDYAYAAFNTSTKAWEMMNRGQWLGPVTEEHFTSGRFKAVMKLGK